MLLKGLKIILALLLATSAIWAVKNLVVGYLLEKQSVHPERGEIIEAIYLLGKVKANRTWDLKLAVASRIESISILEGEKVLADSPLMELIYGTVLKAPFDGVVSRIALQPGEIIIPGQVILTLTDMNRRFIVVTLEQQNALRLKSGMKAQLSIGGDQSWTGVISDPYTNQDQILARIDSQQMPDNLWPGVIVDVCIELGRKPDALLVPKKAVWGDKLILVQGNKTKEIDVKTGLVDDEKVEIISNNLTPSDHVLIRD